ncbi:MAG: glycosyltransferase [Bacteroidales bacterium]|jgi:glycosyltransferase involved in cell wall biosynthesis|nr:glycosyltransferase [Bacteroidales bacterium]
MNKKTIVISAVNFSARVGGAYSVLRECLEYLSGSSLTEKYRIVIIAGSKDVCPYKDIECLEFPKSKKQWIYRMYYEYVYFRKLSKQFNPYLWLSLHDMTPNVIAERQAVYMHNTSVFYSWKWKDFSLDRKVFLFAIFYKYIYHINIHRNRFLIVQQDWIRKEFSRMFNVSKKKIIVAYPTNKTLNMKVKSVKTDDICRFFYPSVPRIFKNFEVICEAVKILNSMNVNNFEVTLTLNGQMTDRYSKMIFHKYSDVKHINFVGLLLQEEVFEQYSKTDCLIFPSKSETWGLPISEFAKYEKPMLLADLAYAHTAATGCDKVSFFAIDDSPGLANKMLKIISGDLSALKAVPQQSTEQPFTQSWEELFDVLLNN